MTFKLTKDHYVLKKDIPDEETFNKIVQAFVGIGAKHCKNIGQWNHRFFYERGAIVIASDMDIYWTDRLVGKTRATPQQILGDNYMKDPLYPNGKADDVVNVELTRKEVAVLTLLAGNICWSGETFDLFEKLQNISGFDAPQKITAFKFGSNDERDFITQQIIDHFAPRKPTEKELRQAKIAELKQTIAELEALDDHQDR